MDRLTVVSVPVQRAAAGPGRSLRLRPGEGSCPDLYKDGIIFPSDPFDES